MLTDRHLLIYIDHSRIINKLDPTLPANFFKHLFQSNILQFQRQMRLLGQPIFRPNARSRKQNKEQEISHVSQHFSFTFFSINLRLDLVILITKGLPWLQL